MNRWTSNWKGKIRLGWPPLGKNNRTRCSAEFRTLFVQLHAAEVHLERASVELEKQFLATSTELETLTRFGDEFVKQVETLVSLATGNECSNSTLSDAIQLVEQSTAFLVGCHQETDQMLELLRNYNAQIEHLLKVETELQSTMLPLKFVQTLFKQESAPLGHGIQEMFGALTHEIEELHNQVRDIFGTKFKQLEQTHETIGQVINQMVRQAQSLRQATAIHKAKIEASIETLKKEMTSNQQRDARLGQVSKDLADDVGQIVMGLQFQDIINQKLQHVRSALPQIEAKFNEFEAASDPAAASKPLQFLHQSCRLEAEQLQTAQAELAKVEASIQSGIQKVLGRLTETDSQCLSLGEFKLLTTSFDGMVQVLVEMIGEVRELVAATVASAAEAHEMLRPLGSLASDLTAIVRSMSSRIHLIGLNAQLQAARAAQDRRGAGLEVLSARTSEISEETNRISEQAATQLDAVAAGLAESVKTLGQLHADAQAQQTLMNEQGRTHEQALHAFRDNALETLRAMGASMDDIRTQTHRTLESVRFAEFHQVTLPALRTPLAAIAGVAEQWLEAHGAGTVQASLIDGFKRDYTMASEHRVYEGFASADGLSVSTAPTAESDANREIELFDDPPAGAEPALALPVGQTAETTPTVPDATPASASDLGANAELF